MKVTQHDPPELLRYFVASESRAETTHLVDLLEQRCSCEDWQFRCQPDPEQPPCKHILGARDVFAVATIEEIRRRVKRHDGP